jgi:ankyrin repeat protein
MGACVQGMQKRHPGDVSKEHNKKVSYKIIRRHHTETSAALRGGKPLKEIEGLLAEGIRMGHGIFLYGRNGSRRNTFVHLAASCHNTDFLAHLFAVAKHVDGGVWINDVNRDGETAVHCALKTASSAKPSDVLATVTFLCRQGANLNIPDKTGKYPLDHCWRLLFASKGKEQYFTDKQRRDMGRLMVSAFAQRGNTLLHYLAKTNCARYTKQCLKKPYKLTINAKDNRGNTPLHFSARKNDRLMALNLIEHGASLDIKNKKGVTPRDIMTMKPCLSDLLDEPLIDSKKEKNKEKSV